MLPEVLTPEQVAEYLQLTVQEVTQELEQQTLPGLKIAGKWRIQRLALDQLLNPATTPSQPTSQPQPNPDPPPPIPEPIPSPPKKIASKTDPPLDSVTSPQTIIENPAPPPQSNPITLPPIPLGYEQAKIFSSNPQQGYGTARLSDNRSVWLDYQKLIEPNRIPLPGDWIQFEPYKSGKLLKARNIQIIARFSDSPKIITPSPKPALSTPPPQLTPSPPAKLITTPPTKIPKPTPITPSPTEAPSPPSRSGSFRSQQLYQQAALARTEGRFDDARRLFRQAIEADAEVAVYAAFFRMEREESRKEDARRIIQEAIERFPNEEIVYELYGQMERRARNFNRAEEIFRQGLAKSKNTISLKRGLAQTLVELGTETSLKEAERIFKEIEAKIDKRDPFYQRSKTFQQNPRANQAFDFFRAAGMIVNIYRQRELPPGITNIVVETKNQELDESFGLNGAFLVRCFRQVPTPTELSSLVKFLNQQGTNELHLGDIDRKVVLNPIAFIAVPNSEQIKYPLMNLFVEGKSNEIIVPLDDISLQERENSLNILRDVLGQYLGQRDLYKSTDPVSGRLFFGRESLLLQLADEIQRGQFLGIYGLRKMGKTSLVHQLSNERLRSEAVATVDLQASLALTIRTFEPLYWEIERALYNRLVERFSSNISNILRLGRMTRFTDLSSEQQQQAGVIFNEDIKIFLEALVQGNFPGVNHLIIILDELERILPVGGQSGVNGYLEFFALLRGLAQTERYRHRLTSVVIAANASISERGYWEKRENPVFGLYKPIFLPPLTADESQEMIKTLGKGMGIYWETEATQLIFEETNGHPFLIRLLCSRIVKKHPKRPLNVNRQMVEEQIGPFLRDEGDKFEQIIELLHENFPTEERLLEQIALDKAEGDLPDEMIRHLLGYHLILAGPNDGYRVALNLLRSWLRKRAGVRT